MSLPPQHPPASSDARPAESPDTPLVRHYLDILRRRIWVVLSVAVVFSCIGAVRTFRTPDVYSATTQILVERQMPKMGFGDPNSGDFAAWDPDFYSTQAQLIRSQPVLELAVTDPEIARVVGQDAEANIPALSERMKEIILAALGAPPQQVQEPWEKLSSYLTTKPVGGTHLLNITVAAHDARTPALLANGVARAFDAYIRKSRTDQLGDAFVYLKEEREREEQKYLLAENDLQNFREESKGIDLRSSKDSPAIDKLSTLNTRLTELQLRRAELKSQIVVIREILHKKEMGPEERAERMLAVPIIKDDSSIQNAREKVLNQKSTIASLADVYGAEHPLLQKARDALASYQEEFNDALQRAVLLHANRLQSLQTEEDEVNTQYEKQKTLALETDQVSFKMARLEMEVDRHRQLFDTLVKRMLEVEMTSGFDTTNVNIIKEAKAPRSPIGPDRKRDILFAVLMGLALGLGIAVVIETMDDTIKTPEDLRENLDIPLLGFIPEVQLKAIDKTHPRINTLFAVDEPVSSIAEAFRQIRTNLFYSLNNDSAKVVATTSCHPGEGKTTTISNLAAVIAQSGRRVLLIDGDFHRPNVHKIFGVESSMGLADILSGSVPWTEAVITPQRDGHPLNNLDVIVAGNSNPSASERLSSTAMKQFIEQARDKYDWVLVDSPPLLFVSDASVLSAMCDGVILVVKSGMNNRSLLAKTRDHLRQLKVNILGTILNRMVVAFMGRHYSYYYYHGYSRYSEDYPNAYYGQTPEEKAALTVKAPSPRPEPPQEEARTASPAIEPPPPHEPPAQEIRRENIRSTSTQTVVSTPIPETVPTIIPLPDHRPLPSSQEPSPRVDVPLAVDRVVQQSTEELDRVKASLDDIELQQAEIFSRLQSILNRKPGELPRGPKQPPPSV